mgnify:CR=1 FL=1
MYSSKTVAAVLCVLLAVSASSCGRSPEILAPADGVTIETNTPVLAWSQVDCDKYELWINDIKVGEYGPDVTGCVPFPVSFGEQEWCVKAVRGDRTISSRTSTFRVEAPALSRLPESAQVLREGWLVKSSLSVEESGAELSSEGASGEGWARTSIPATVLTALVRGGFYPNPLIEMNNMLIPDSDDEYNSENDLLKYSHIPGMNPWKDPYWYVTSFDYGQLPEGRVILNFNEINYRGEVWLNGARISDPEEMVGMERSYAYDVTECIKAKNRNYLAVKIYPVDVPGKPEHDPVTALDRPGENMGDGRISTSYTKWDTMGWDWQPPVRDRDMGITEEVFLSVRKDVVIDNLYITSDLELPSLSSADITVSADVCNYSGEVLDGNLVFSLTGDETVNFTVPCHLDPYAKQPVLVSGKEIEQLSLKSPHLWWPAGYGDQYLYRLSVNFESSACQSDPVEENFGIRKVNTYLGPDERVIEINGRRVYPVGGNWVMDMMLNWTAPRYEREILLTRNSGMNMLRIWGPTGVAPEAFYDAADKYGVMLWQDFLNDYWGTFQNKPGYRPDEKLFCDISSEVVKKYRNHPSLVMWCGGNEGINPRENKIMEEILPSFDGRDSRFYLRSSNADGLHGSGPYNTLEPARYFSEAKLHGFSSEIGPSGVPVLESIDKALNHKENETAEGRKPLDGYWAFHDANDWPGRDLRKFSTYDNIVRGWYGASSSEDSRELLADYADKCQLVNYDVYRASIEAINRQLWDRASGILLWKSNSSWPSLTWQIYDWYLQAHAGYYATKIATSHIGVQWNRDNNSITVVNLRTDALEGATVTADYYGIDGKKISSESDAIGVAGDCVAVSGIRVKVPDSPQILRLTLTGSDGRELTRNTYWICSDNDFTSFTEMPAPELSVSVKSSASNGKIDYELTVANDSENIALLTQFRLAGKKSGYEILPSLWSDNFVTLLPGEKRILNLSVFESDAAVEPAEIQYRSFGSPAGQFTPVCPEKVKKGNPSDTLRILAIGNSFSVNAVEQNLHEIAAADGKCAIIGNMYIGGCSLERHYNNSLTANRDYSYRKIDASGHKTVTDGVTLEEALADDNWDVVTFQQASHFSGLPDTYEPYLTGLIEFVQERVPAATKFYWHQTWAYAQTTGHEAFPNYDSDQGKMYEEIVSAAAKACRDHDLTIIPCGTAIQNVRGTFIGDNVNVPDGYHLNEVGCYAAACTWYQTLFGKSVVGNGFEPSGITENERISIQKCVRSAVRKN